MLPLYKKYGKAKPIATKGFTNTFGICIYEPTKKDSFECDCVASWSDGENEYGFHKHKVYYSGSGRSYIRKGSLRIYLDECIRTDI